MSGQFVVADKGNQAQQGLEVGSTLDASNLPAHKPKVEFEVVSLREVLSRVPEKYIEALDVILEEDPALNTLREATVSKEIRDISVAHAEIVAGKLCEKLGIDPSEQVATRAINTLVDFYFGYLRPFPDITETEPLQSLVGYVKDLPEWDVLMAQNKEGKIIAASSGQIVTVPYEGGDFKIAWNEHTWCDKEYRRQGIGQTLADLFRDDAIMKGAIGVVIETDNPFLITNDPRAFNHADPKARTEFWTDTEAGLGLSMDPFVRPFFWGPLGYGVLCYGEPSTPIPYTQISMDLGNVGSCETIGLAFNPTSDAYKDGLPKDMYIAALVALQKTIDPDATFYPELVRTIKQIEETPATILHFVNLADPKINEVIERARPTKVGAAEADLEYCNKRLKFADIADNEREILEKSRDYLMQNKAA